MKKTLGGKTKPKAASARKLRLIERRKHPRFLLSGEQFKEAKSRRIFSVYDLSMTGFSIKIDEQYWDASEVVQGVLNLHPESIEVSGRLLGYYNDRAALRFEIMSTYARTSLARSLSAPRLGKSLQPVKEKLNIADHWYHGVCNTDVLVRLVPVEAAPDIGTDIDRVDVFFSNYYCGWNKELGKLSSGICQSVGSGEKLSELLASQEPVTLEGLELAYDSKLDGQKVDFARAILDAAQIEPVLKRTILEKFNPN